jgi:MFS family permease
MADLYGRRRFFLSAMVIDLVLFTYLYLTTSLTSVYVLSFLIGAMTSMRIQVGFIWLMELLTQGKQVLFGTAYNVLEGLMQIFIPIYYLLISTDSNQLFLYGIVYQVLNLCMIFFVPESPRFLIQK